ncbi:hypothetical protein [Consotaella salsifontis]|uniref:Endonuclease III n=1 Tax=Consotaella salsifontis TaxID=1365950 RepID=A0A1T4T8K6_9HYPH|nr:hypothetical protein [Consotaella salsifontis]SKA36766.1 Endonuclease III [Consotaella salsifontis]
MSKREEKVALLLERFGTSYSADVGLDLSTGEPQPLFQWLVVSVLFSARISADQAARAARALFDAGLTSAEKMGQASWEERTRILNQNGYARYDESTSRYLGEDAAMCLEAYGGDLRRLREEAGRDPAEERKRLKAFKGIGEVGADIFLREMQPVWDENHPFADKKALAAAEKIGLGEDARALAKLVSKKDLPRLLSALVKADLHDGLEEIGKA